MDAIGKLLYTVKNYCYFAVAECVTQLFSSVLLSFSLQSKVPHFILWSIWQKKMMILNILLLGFAWMCICRRCWYIINPVVLRRKKVESESNKAFECYPWMRGHSNLSILLVALEILLWSIFESSLSWYMIKQRSLYCFVLVLQNFWTHSRELFSQKRSGSIKILW